ncbi:hypothetical protein HID58_082576 [Brassica napus]|uniref:Uncharacterized protein n=1 Tax=Brassica napus TaxID=3708 RepID=A0ABQ7YE31_BRANA|nr:hypothetical protein HID58_082576 [Brassica napus]
MAKSLCIVTLLMIFLLISTGNGYRKEKLNVWENEASHHPQGSAVYRLEALFATMLALLKNISAANVKLRTQEQFVIVTIAHLVNPTVCAAWRKNLLDQLLNLY